jgi:2-amino-4-hydroxy-6-hydroxymethyldihydropteridine diphosphokinase
MRAWLGLGSNLEQPAAQLNIAIASLDSIAKIEVLQTSGFYRTPPWGDSAQDDFINAVVEIETGLGAMPLLRVLQSIENTMGRLRSERRWGPRLIDIDLLLYGDLVFQTEELEVPHPRMHERAFVLMPLLELEKSLVIPGRGKVAELLKNLDCSGISRLNDYE